MGSGVESESSPVPRDRPVCRLLALLCTVIVISATGYCLASSALYTATAVLDPPAAPVGTVVDLTWGLMTKCTTTTQPGEASRKVCVNATQYTDLNFGTCHITAKQQRQSFFPVMAGALIAAATALISIPWYLCCDGNCVQRYHANLARVIHSAIVFIASGAAFLSYAYTMRSWYFCGVRYCELVRTVRHDAGVRSCVDGPGIDGWVYAGVVGAALLGMVLCIAAWDCTPPGELHQNEPFTMPPPTMLRDCEATEFESPFAPPTNAEPDENRREQSSRKEAASDDDWELDKDTGMWWSDKAGLFLHVDEETKEQLFYDPASELWGTADGQWFKGDEA